MTHYIHACIIETHNKPGAPSKSMTIKAELKQFFGEPPRRVAVLGVGNPIRGDDGVGVHILQLLESMDLKDTLLLNTETVPEAFTGKVTAYEPTHVLLLDAANFRAAPGEMRLIDSKNIGGQALSTHSLPLTIFITYIENSLEAKVLLLGVQPRVIDFGAEMTPEVKKAAEKASTMIKEILG